MAENNTRAWHAVLTKGSAALKKRLTLKHGDKPEFQRLLKSTGQDKETWYKMHLKKQARLRGEDPTTKEKERKQMGLKAWGATKGTRMGGEEGGGLTTDAPKAGKAVVGQYAGAGPVKTLSVAEYMKQKEEEQRREKAKAILAARAKMNEEKDVQHLIGITVSHPELKSAEPIFKKARVRASSEEEAIKKVESHYRKAGYKVHPGTFHHSTLTFNRKVDEGTDEACWKGYKAVGKKMKNGRVVPNCVPVKEESVDEAATSDNTGYGKGYHGNIGGDDKKYSSMHTKVKRLVGAAGHLSDVKKPNVMVKHFLDSKHGRHIADQPSDTNITSRFKKFKKTYNPEMYESIDEGMTKAINKKMKNTLSAMRGRAALGEPEKGLSWQQNKAKAIKAGRAMAKEEVEQMEEGTVDLTKTLIKKIKAKGDTAYRSKKTGLLTLRKKSVKEEYADYIKDYGRSRRGRAKAMAQHQADQERSRGYQGYHTQIHVDGRHYKAGDRIGMGEKGAQEAAKHAANIAKKTGKKVSIHMIHHETGKTLAIADHDNGNWSYRKMNEGYKEDIKAAPFDTTGARKVKKTYKDKYGNVVKNIAKHLAKKGMASAMKKEEAEQMDENDLGLRGLVSTNPQSIPNYAYKTQKGKEKAAKKNIPALKSAIKSALGRHPKPNLPEEANSILERAKWRSSSAAKPDPDNDWDRSSKSTGGMRASSDTRGDTGGEYSHSSLENRRKAQVASKGPNAGKTTKASNASLKGRILGNLANKQSKPNLPEEVEQIDERGIVGMINKIKAKSQQFKTGGGVAAAKGGPISPQHKAAYVKAGRDAQKLNPSQPKGSFKALTKEEVEQIDELSRETMASYVGKARAKNIKDSAKNRLAGIETSLSDMDKASAKTSKRSKGIQRAYAKLNMKEALDKVGKETADIDNDKDVDKTDMYLHNRRGAIKKAIAKKKLNEGKAAAAADKAIALQRGKGNKINRKPTMEVDMKAQASPPPTHDGEDDSANVKV